MERDSFVFYRSFYESIKGLPAEQFKECITALLEYGLNDEEEANSVMAKVFLGMAKPQIDKNKQRYENGKKGGRPKKEETKTENQEPNVNVNDNVNVNVNEKEKSKKKKAEPFKPPTFKELVEFCADANISIDVNRFIDYYESNGWMVGKNKMKSWKATARNWARSNQPAQKPAPKPKNQFNNFSNERQYSDMDALERQLLGLDP